jgi:radical SAM protein with 4Fe4S-binding SPASM domain
VTFKKIYLEISNICNLQCSFCPPVERTKAVLDRQHLESYLDKIKNHAERVCFHVMGEPLGHAEFPLFVSLAEELKVPLEITTNGTLLNEENQQALLSKTIVQVNFSVQSFFDNFPKADPKTYTDKLIQFAHKAVQVRPDLYINFRLWNLESTGKEGLKNENFLKDLELAFQVEINRVVDPGFKKSKKLKERVYLHFDSRFDWPDANKEQKRTAGTCHGTRSHIAIHANGTVVPCCLDKEAQINLGSLETQSLEEILSSARYKNMKAGFESGRLVEEFCQKCTFAERFG